MLALTRTGTAEVPTIDGYTFVDIASLDAIKLPMIARLFLQAVVVPCRRDPRHVVPSLFKSDFRVSSTAMRLMEQHLVGHEV